MQQLLKNYDNPVKVSEWYSHYSLGNRIQKTSSGTAAKYIVDPNRSLPSVLAETNSSGTITTYYVYGLGLISKIEGSSAYFYQYDGLGSTVAITDSTGAVKNKYAYGDFGNLATNSSESISNPYKYVGRFGVMTDASDLLYMRARYYSPSIGRFINKDPIGLVGGLNLYGYTENNPVNLIDPSGLIIPGDPDPTDEIIIIMEIIRRIPWDKVIQVIEKTLKNPFTQSVIRKCTLDGKTVAVFHEIWKNLNGVWMLIHRDFKGPW